MAPSHAPAIHRYSGYWSESVYSPGSGPGRSWIGQLSLIHTTLGELSSTALASSSNVAGSSERGQFSCFQALGSSKLTRTPPGPALLRCEGFTLGILFDSHKFWSVKFLKSMKAKLKALWRPQSLGAVVVKWTYHGENKDGHWVGKLACMQGQIVIVSDMSTGFSAEMS